MKPLSIAMLSSFYFPHIGGTERYVHDLSEALVRRGHRVTVFTHYPGKDSGEYGDGIVVRRVPSLWLPYQPLFAAFPADLINTFDVLHSHAPPFAFTRRASGLGVPHIVTYHCDVEIPDQVGKMRIPGPVKIFFDRYFQERARAHLERVDRIVATTRSYAESSPVLSGLPFEVVPIGIHGEKFLETARRLGLSERDRKEGEILYVGRLAASKGLVYLLQSARILKERGADFHVTIIGSGEDALMLKIMAREYGLEEYVHFAGRTNFDDLLRGYARASLLVLPSFVRLEAFGIVQLEALCMGTPVVATDLPGVKDVVAASGGGRLVPARDPGAMSEAILDLLSRPLERKAMGETGRNWVLRNRRWDEIAERFEIIYGELIR